MRVTVADAPNSRFPSRNVGVSGFVRVEAPLLPLVRGRPRRMGACPPLHDSASHDGQPSLVDRRALRVRQAARRRNGPAPVAAEGGHRPARMHRPHKAPLAPHDSPAARVGVPGPDSGRPQPTAARRRRPSSNPTWPTQAAQATAGVRPPICEGASQRGNVIWLPLVNW